MNVKTKIWQTFWLFESAQNSFSDELVAGSYCTLKSDENWQSTELWDLEFLEQKKVRKKMHSWYWYTQNSCSWSEPKNIISAESELIGRNFGLIGLMGNLREIFLLGSLRLLSMILGLMQCTLWLFQLLDARRRPLNAPWDFPSFCSVCGAFAHWALLSRIKCNKSDCFATVSRQHCQFVVINYHGSMLRVALTTDSDWMVMEHEVHFN